MVFLNYLSSAKVEKSITVNKGNVGGWLVSSTATILSQEQQKNAINVRDNMDYNKDPGMCNGVEC